jgi:hypothetical protein
VQRSEVAVFQEKQALEAAAVQSGLYGPASVAPHAMIAEKVGHILLLPKEGRREEADRLLDLSDWGEETEPDMSHFDGCQPR